MNYVDPELFDKFVANQLPREQMFKIERELLANGTAKAVFASVITEYLMRTDVDELIGPDEEPNNIWREREKIFNENCSKIQLPHSFETNTQTSNQMKNFNISKEDMAKVAERFQQINSVYDPSLSLIENLVSAYKAARQEATDEEASRVCSKLIEGCDTLTRNYHTALADGFDPADEINRLTDGLSTEQRFNFLVNAMVAVDTLNIESYPENKDVTEAIKEALEKYNAASAQPTDADCEELQKLLEEAITNNTLLLSGLDTAKQLLASSTDTATVIDFVSSRYDDARIKAQMALAMWMEYKNGQLTSIPDGASPETIGVGAASAVEEAKIINDVATGATTAAIAIKCLKVLGGVALFLLLGYVGILGMAVVGTLASGAMLTMLGTSALACIVTTAVCLPLLWGLAQLAINGGEKVMEKAGEFFDYVVEKLRTSILPATKRIAIGIIDWIKEKLGYRSKPVATITAKS